MDYTDLKSQLASYATGAEKILDARGIIMAEALAAIEELEARVEKVMQDRAYIIGFNSGWDECVAQFCAEPACVRHSFDGHGYLYSDGGNGSDWFDRAMLMPNAEPLFEAPDRMNIGNTDIQTNGGPQ